MAYYRDHWCNYPIENIFSLSLLSSSGSLIFLGTEVLSRLIQQQESIGLLHGIKIGKFCAPISHLLFAEDILIFGKPTSIEAVTIKYCLDSYCAWSGQKVNIAKSSIHFSKNTFDFYDQ
jgi:hypothetical protein